MLTILYAMAGGIFRRYFGGWLDWPKYDEKALINKNRLKKALGHVLGAVLIYWLTYSPSLAIVSGLILGLVWYMIRGHAKSMVMGYGDWPFWKCAGNFILWYGGAMMLVGWAWAFICHSAAGHYYAAMGLFVWLPHWIAQRFFAWVPEKPNAATFIDARTAIGEVGLGAIVYGGIALAYELAKI